MTATSGARRRVDLDRLAELEDERRFLLGSLRDLEREHDVGDVDDDDYQTLREGYTVRAAEVLRAIEAGRSALPRRGATNWWRILGWVGIVVAIAVAAGVVVARSSGQRLPGQEITGGVPGGDVPAMLVQARSLMFAGDVPGAQALYGEVLEERPDHPEALAYNGWLLAILAQGAGDEIRPVAMDTAKESLRRSIEADPGYADPYCFLAIIAANFEDDQATAATEAEACLANDPPADMRGLLDEFVLGLEE